MNSKMKKYWNNYHAFRLTVLAIPFALCCFSDVAVGAQSGQQPSQHLFGAGNQLQPKAPGFEKRTSQANDFVGQKLPAKNPDVIRDSKVERVAFREEIIRPIRDITTSNTRREAGSNWNYQLKNLDYQGFETKLADIWGDRLLGGFLDGDKRTLRMYLPAGKTAPEASVKFDRVSGLLTYEGAPSRLAGFRSLMQAIDQPEIDGVGGVKVIDVSAVENQVVQQVVSLYQVPQDEQGRSFELPPNVNIQDLPPLKGTIRVRQNPETNSIIISSSDPEDGAAIERFLNAAENNPAMSQANSRSVKLISENADELLEKVRELYQGRLESLHGEVLLNTSAVNNTIIIVGAPSALDAAEKLIRDFDGQNLPDPGVDPPEKPLTAGEKGYQQYSLRHISADEAERAVLALFNQNATSNVANRSQGLPINTFINRRANSLTVIGSGAFIARASQLIREIDVPASKKKAERILRVFKIKNHAAPDFQIILQDTLNGQFDNPDVEAFSESQLQAAGGGGQTANDGDPVVPNANIRFQRADGTFTELSADFFDVRINSDAAGNTLTVVAPAEAMEVIAEIIEELDKLPDLVSEVKVIKVINGDATEILATLDQIFNGTGGAAAAAGGATTGSSNLPLQSPGSDGSSLINIRFAVNERTNEIIVSGAPADLDFVTSLVRRLDGEDVNDRQIVTYRLSNASVVDVEATLQDFFDDLGIVNAANPIAGAGPNNAGVTAARQQIVISIEPTSNTMVVSARPEHIAMIDHLVSNLDRRPTMVKVKAQIVQVDLNQLENFGVEFGLQDSSIFDAGLSDTIGTGFFGLDQAAGQLVSDLGVGRSSTVAGVPGFVLSAGSESLNFVLRFLKQKGCANVLFSPEIMTMENLAGRINQGAEIQRQGGVVQNATTATQDVEEEEIGISLEITPRVSPDGMIVMFVDVSNRSLGPIADGTVIGTDVNNAQIISQPINQTVVQTAISARSGQTVAISGFFEEQKSQTVTSIPFLGDLPVIGPLFQSVENTADRTELLIVLTPYIVDGEDDISVLNQDDFDRMNWCRSDVAELYGNTDYTGAPYREPARKVFYPGTDPLGQNPVVEQPTAAPQQNSMPADEWTGEGEQLFPPVNNRNQNDGSGRRSLDDDLQRGSSSRTPLPSADPFQGGSSYQRQPMPPELNGRRPQRSYPQQGRDQQELRNQIGQPSDSRYRSGPAEYVAPPVPGRQVIHRDAGARYRTEDTASRQVFSDYSPDPRNLPSGYQGAPRSIR